MVQVDMGAGLTCPQKIYEFLEARPMEHNEWSVMLLQAVFGEEAYLFRTKASVVSGMKVFPKIFIIIEAKKVILLFIYFWPVCCTPGNVLLTFKKKANLMGWSFYYVFFCQVTKK